MLLLLHLHHVILILSLYPSSLLVVVVRCQKRFMWKKIEYYVNFMDQRLKEEEKTQTGVNEKVLNKLKKESRL